MAKRTITIDTILNGQSNLKNFAGQGQFMKSIAIDPDMPIDDTEKNSSGYLRPTAMEDFTSTQVNSVPRWILTNPKDSKVYVVLENGRIVSYSSALASETLEGTLTSFSGGGAAYYDNYLYFRKNADIARFGPLDGTASLTQDYWTSSLSLTAPTDTTYPSLRGVEIPNGVMHRHIDDKLYFTDVLSSNKGSISYVKTTKTTVEGDTNDTSTHDALDFDYGVYPVTLETYGNDLAIGLIEGTNTTTLQKPAAIAFWDTTSTTYNKIVQVELPDPLITAMRNVNGILYVWTGNASGGYRLIRFVGGYSWEEVWYSEDGLPPLQSAVDHDLNRIYWGGHVTDPEEHGAVMALGSKQRGVRMGVHNVLKSSNSGATPNVTCLKLAQHASNAKRSPLVGWTDDSDSGVDKLSTTYGTSIFRSEMFRVGRPFNILSVRMPLSQAVAANMTITPKIYFDDSATNTALRTLNNTNFSESERYYEDKPEGLRGNHNFFLELKWTGTALLTVALPIIIEIEVIDEDNA